MYTIEIQDLSQAVNNLVLESSLSPVQSVNGMIGNVNLTAEKIGLGLVNNTPDLDKPVSIPVSGALLALEQRILSQVQLSSQEDLEFQIGLYSGIDSLRVYYPYNLPQKPKSVTCEIENNVDNLIYNHQISDVTNESFSIEFSDFLSSDGYILHVVASI